MADPDSTTTVFLAAVDGSESSGQAAAFAAMRAKAEGATLRLVHVVDWSPYEIIDVSEAAGRPGEREEEIAKAQQEILDPLVAKLSDGITIETEVHHGHPSETIARLAEQGVTQVFVGRRGRSKLKALIFGSVAGGLVQVCPVPLTVVP